MEKKFIPQLIKRLSSYGNTPSFFKKFFWYIIAISVVVAGLTWVNDFYPLPAIIQSILGYDIALYIAGLAIGALTPVQDTTVLEDKKEDK